MREAHGLPVALLLLLATAGAALGQERWEERLWNRQPAEGDLVLPMPCGGAMAFRPVEVRGEGPPDNLLTDMSFSAGLADERSSYSEYLHEDHVAGSFTSEAVPGTRLYYLGKYEVTLDQYAAVMGEGCPEASPRGTFPVEDASWFAAVDFTRRYSEWLLAEGRQALPAEDGVPGYVRLPTEAEWEFAARGGMAVTDTQREGRLFPTDGRAIDEFAWFAATDSCDGATQPVGLKAANPLGLFDVVGNVREIVLEPFRMTRAGRLHGQVGGFVSKGGACDTRAELLRTSDREEHFFFDPTTGTATRSPFTGFRVMVAAPVETSFARIERYRQDWTAAREQRLPVDPGAEPIAALERLAETSEDPDVADALRTIGAAFAAEMQARNGVDARAARTSITAGVQLIRLYSLQARLVEQLGAAIAACEGDAACADRYQQAMEARLTSQEVTRNVFLDLLRRVAADYDQGLLENELMTVQDQYGSIGGASFADLSALFVALAGERRSERVPTDDEVMERVTAGER
jgi:hypothetical protein